MQIDELLQSLKDKRNRLEIDPEVYHLWKTQNMTQALFLELEIAHLDSIMHYSEYRDDRAYCLGERRGAQEQLADIIDWKPREMEGDYEDN